MLHRPSACAGLSACSDSYASRLGPARMSPGQRRLAGHQPQFFAVLSCVMPGARSMPTMRLPGKALLRRTSSSPGPQPGAAAAALRQVLRQEGHKLLCPGQESRDQLLQVPRLMCLRHSQPASAGNTYLGVACRHSRPGLRQQLAAISAHARHSYEVVRILSCRLHHGRVHCQDKSTADSGRV